MNQRRSLVITRHAVTDPLAKPGGLWNYSIDPADQKAMISCPYNNYLGLGV
jgi:hypothetical protein